MLDISKTLVYNSHYAIMHRIVNPNYVQLMYTDTDSLVYDVTHTDMNEVMKQNPQYFDTSDYPEHHRFGLALLNKKVIGLMKDECAGREMTEFAGLRSKMYSARVEGKDVLKKNVKVSARVLSKRLLLLTISKHVSITKRSFTARSEVSSPGNTF